MSTEAMASAVKAVGSQTALAKTLGCTPQNVQRMCATGRVPPKHVLRIEAASGVSRCLLRPDLYPEEPSTLNEKVQAFPIIEQTNESAVNLSSTAQASP
ncbi:YdaS family helix-turn-helix protein [Pseudomonas putida]|uniref:transcriptional regulator n=1 Tax=Pseudomonas TaxID=286 RepID=UPI000F3D247A|nr:YdaS family helix-turn-helix protein [Pseudomonas putida]RNF69047.1 hypothetical protein EFJ98_18325 [Pseudomonas putida]